MIFSTSVEETPSHAIEPLVQNLIREHRDTEDILRSAWESVLLFLDDGDRACFSEPDATALLYARALASCNQRDAARRIAELVPCAIPLLRHLDVGSLPLNSIRALASGVVRPVTNSLLSGGLTLVLDGSRFQSDSHFDMDLFLFPALRKLLNDALALLALGHGRGLLVFRGWSRSDDNQEIREYRRDMVEAWLEQKTDPTTRPELIWVD